MNCMTLAEFLAKYPRAYREDHAGGGAWVDILGQTGASYRAACADICHLSDYAVSSHAGGVYYLVPR